MGRANPKRLPSLTDEWMRDVWNVRGVDFGEGELSKFDQLISSAVSRCLKDEDRNEISDTLSLLFGEAVTVHMLNAYASEARRAFRIPASRFLALIAVTGKFDILDAILREVGGKALDRNDAKIFNIGVDYITSVNAARILREKTKELFAPFEP